MLFSLSFCHRQTESDTYEPTVQLAQVGSKKVASHVAQWTNTSQGLQKGPLLTTKWAHTIATYTDWKSCSVISHGGQNEQSISDFISYTRSYHSKKCTQIKLFCMQSLHDSFGEVCTKSQDLLKMGNQPRSCPRLCLGEH